MNFDNSICYAKFWVALAYIKEQNEQQHILLLEIEGLIILEDTLCA